MSLARNFRWLVAGFLTTMVMLAQSAAPAADPSQASRLIEQKLKLVEMLLKSSAAPSGDGAKEAERAAQKEKSLELVKLARDALAAGRLDEATHAAHEALSGMTKAISRVAAKPVPSEENLRKQFQELKEQVGFYRTSLAGLVRDPRVGEGARQLLERVDTLLMEGNQAFAKGNLKDGNEKMAAAYKVSVEEISRLRAGHEVVISLKFDTPGQELEYEEKRFQSGRLMVQMMIEEGRADGQRRGLVDRYTLEAASLRDEAATLALDNRHTEAIERMEKAVKALNRALQSMGVPVF